MEFIFWSCTKFGTCTICKSILALTQKIWTITKSFSTCRRIRHQSIFCVLAAPIEGTRLPLGKQVRIRSAIVLILETVIFHKTVILGCWTGLKLNWFKNYDINAKKRKNEKKCIKMKKHYTQITSFLQNRKKRKGKYLRFVS